MIALRIVGTSWHLVRISSSSFILVSSHYFYAAYPSFLSASNSVALYYVDHSTMAPRVKENKTDRIIALLSPSCADLFVTLFAALRLSYGVLLLA